MKLFTVASLALLAPLAAPSAGPVAVSTLPTAPPVQDEAPTAYARVAGAGARVFNMQDDKGTVVQKPAAGTLLAVYRDTGSWLEVEVPGGFPVWVFGRFLGATAEADVYRVNGDGVNLRPKPSTGVTNFPLSQQLYTGDQVRVIERADPKLPLKQDWVRIWSPPGVRGWIQKSDAKMLAAGEDGAGLWKAAVAALPAAPERAQKARTKPAETQPAATEASAPKPSADGKAKFEAALQTALDRAEAERAKDTPDWGAVRALYAEAQRAATDGAELAQVRSGLKAVDALEEASQLRAQLEGEKRRREEAARLEQERVWAESREKDPLGGVFLARGALERVVAGVGEAATKRYFLKFGTGVVAEVVCVSGRYDLDVFVGYQIGVRGTELRAAEDDGLRHIEVTRVEVIARRP